MFAIVIVILIFLFFVIMDILTENDRKKREEERKQREAEEKKKYEKRRQEELARQRWLDTLYPLALKIGEESGINHLHRIILGFKMRQPDLISEEEDLLLVAEWAMKELTTDPNYFTPPPPIPQQIPQPFDYETSWWKKYSEWYRNEKGWTCEECELDLNHDRYYLHTHHRLGTQYNRPEHLEALCLGCHAEQSYPPGHHVLKEDVNYAEFIAKYGERCKKTLNAFKALSLQFAMELAKVSLNQGVAKAKLGQHNEAVKDYDAAIRLNPDYVLTYYNRGLAKNEMGQYEEAIADYDAAIRLNPDYTNAYHNRGVAKARLGQHNDAVKDYNTVVRLKPNHTLAYYNRALTMKELFQTEKSKQDFLAALRLATQTGDVELKNKIEKTLRSHE